MKKNKIKKIKKKFEKEDKVKFKKRRKRYSHRIYYFTDYQLVVVVHDASTSQVAKCFLAGRPLMPKSLLQRFKFRKNPEPKQQIFDLFSFQKTSIKIYLIKPQNTLSIYLVPLW